MFWITDRDVLCLKSAENTEEAEIVQTAETVTATDRNGYMSFMVRRTKLKSIMLCL